MNKTVKVFLSQPMRGFTDEEIIARREEDIKQLKKILKMNLSKLLIHFLKKKPQLRIQLLSIWLGQLQS